MKSVHELVQALDYVREFSGKTVLIKVGGAALQEEELVKKISEDIIRLQSVGIKVVLVHGGGPSINDELTVHGIQWNFHNGQRVTTPAMMEIVEMVLSGKVNRRIVRALNHVGARAVGISGSDAMTLQCKQASTELGQVGEITEVDPTLVQSMLNTKTQAGFSTIPVIAPVGIGSEGQAFNINADWAASWLARALKVSKVIFLTDQEGILDKNQKLISEIDAGELEQLIEDGTVTGGMLTKTRAILNALKSGISHVHILNAKRVHSLIEELFTEQGVGTVCKLRSRGPQKN